MDQKTRAIIIGAVVLLLLVATTGTVVFLSRSKDNGPTTGGTGNSLSNLPVVSNSSTTPAPTGASNNPVQSADSKLYQTNGLNIRYPKGWGLLTCSNSTSFELDPTSGTDVKNVVCDQAVKPITILLPSRLSCSGETVKLGDNNVVRSKNTDSNGDIDYRWCLSISGKNLDITHRVSPSGVRATSKDDSSAQVEQLIKNIQPTVRAS